MEGGTPVAGKGHKMNENEEILEPIEFSVGETYTNEKGIFEVISIKRDEMVIRWEDGKEITTGITLQQKIQERRQWETIVREKAKTAGSGKARGGARGKLGSSFEGLNPEDFRDKISRTKWRNRNQLGGAVTTQITMDQFRFNSWAAQGENGVHWADADRFKATNASSHARFFSRADESLFIFGFCVKRPGKKEVESANWAAFDKWVRDPVNDQWIREIALDEGLEIYNGSQKDGKDVIRPQKDGWAAKGSRPMSKASVGDIIDVLSEDARLNFVIAKQIPKADAIEKKKAIAEEVARLFNRLLPLYEGVVDPKK
jgi:hypothetical protein